MARTNTPHVIFEGGWCDGVLLNETVKRVSERQPGT